MSAKLSIITAAERWARLVATVAAVFIIAYVFADLFGRIHDNELHACHRLNILRSQYDHSELADYQSEVAAASFNQLFIDAIKAGPAPQTVTERHLAARFVNALTNLVTEARALASEKTWIPMTDCPTVVFGSHGLAPLPVRFSTRLPTDRELRLSRRN